MNELLSFTILVALTSGVVQAIKMAFGCKKLCPFIALLVGILLSALADWSNLSSLTWLVGVAVGLSAVGLYDNLENPVKMLYSRFKKVEKVDNEVQV